MSTATSCSGEASEASGNHNSAGGSSVVQQHQHQMPNSNSSGVANSTTSTSLAEQAHPPIKKKRNLPGTPDPDAEVIALSPKTLMATNRFLCEICGKGFQRDQNLQLHRRGHNLPWKLRQRTSKEPRKRVYICPEPGCVHHNPARALGDLTGIKKHFCRKHGEKKWKCDKCNKRYAVQSDWKAHSKTCGTREYRCDCGTLFSRRDSFITHRAFCDALAEENARVVSASKQGGIFHPIVGHDNSTVTGALPVGFQAASSFGGSFPAPGSYQVQVSSGEFLDLPNASMKDEDFPWMKWNQCEGGASAAGPPFTAKRLSLLLGSSSGPPLANTNHSMTGGLAHLHASDPAHLASMDVQSASSYFMQPPKINMHAASSDQMQLTNILNSELEASQWLSSNPFSNPLPPAGMAFPGSLMQSCAMAAYANSCLEAPEMSDYMMGLANRQLDQRFSHNSTAGLSLSSSNGAIPNEASNSATNNDATSRKFPLLSSALQIPPALQLQPSSQMSATALLQKAAQMGATASNSFFHRGFGMASNTTDHTSAGSFGLEAFWQGPSRQGHQSFIGSGIDNKPGAAPNVTSTDHEPMTRRSEEQNEYSGGEAASSLTSPRYGRSSEIISNDEDIVGAMSGYASLFGNSFPTPMFGSMYTNAANVERSTNKIHLPSMDLSSSACNGVPLTKYNVSTCSDNENVNQRNPLVRSTSDPHENDGGIPPKLMLLPGLSVVPKVEEGAAHDQLTRDFLGVAGAGGEIKSQRRMSPKDMVNQLMSMAANGDHVDPTFNNSPRESNVDNGIKARESSGS